MIQTHEEVLRLADSIRTAGCVALDTEFVWERTFFPRLGLIQAGLPGGACCIVDATAGADLEPLGRILEDNSVQKILHDAHQDLTILRRATGAYPRNVFDTRCAAGFVGLTATISLQDLLEKAIGVSLPKTETRTDWLRRPLSDKQISYALDDVRFLANVRDELIQRARSVGTEEWMREELTTYDEPSLYDDRDPRCQYERVKGMGRLSSRKLSVLRETTAWREEEARRRDIPRDHVIPDRTLLAVAQRIPRSENELAALEGISRNGLSRYGSLVLEKVEVGMHVPRRLCPRHTRRHRRPNVKSLVDDALKLLRNRCREAHVDPTLVVTRSELTSLAHEARSADPEKHRLMRGWRHGFVGREIHELFQSDPASTPADGSG